MGGWLGGWVDRLMGGWVGEWMDRWVGGWIDDWVVGGWTGRRMGW